MQNTQTFFGAGLKRFGLCLKRLKYARAWISAAAVAGVLLAPSVASAVTLISQGYSTDAVLPAGAIVSLKKDSITDVTSATVSNVASTLGVVIGDGSSQLSISSVGKDQVQIATSGIEQVLVSDMNGTIAAGDQITASPISGVGMKATASAKVVGVAQDAFPNSTAQKEDYKDKSGQTHSAKLGQVAVLVNVAYYYKQPDKTIIPSTIQNLANALAGKTVNALPILLSVGIFIVTLIVVVSIIYALIHSSIISVGRNPMSQSAVYRNVIQLSLLVVVILAVAVIAIYMVLRKL
ncbi:MAG: rane protein of unknown function [Candidatus Saccharibacteria bacterium]|nr:rane protein of unknown function [Candidatus Saccharibacteria bacterium]